MGIGDFLFGKKPSMETRQLPRWSPEQQKLMKKFAGWAGEDFGEPGEAYPGGSPYGSDISQLSLAGLESMFGADGLMQGAGGKLQDIIKGDPSDFEEYYQKSVYDPMMRQFEEDIIPGIGRQVGSAYWGSERLGQEEKAREDLMQSLVGSRAQMAYGARESALDRSLRAIGMTPEMISGYGMGAEIGARPGQWEYGEWQRQQDVPMRKMMMILQSLGLSPFETMGVGLPGQAGLLQGIAGGAGQAGGAYGIAKIMGLI